MVLQRCRWPMEGVIVGRRVVVGVRALGVIASSVDLSL